MSFRYVKQLPKPELQILKIRDEVIQRLKPVGLAHVYERDQIVLDFKHKPKFGYRIRTTPKQLRLEIYLKNAGQKVSEAWTIDDLWTALDKEGTRPHLIMPKRARRLSFIAGRYRPKTNPGGRFRGPGKVTGGKRVYAIRVKHPGFKARHFSERISKDLRPLFLTQAERGYRIGHQKAIGLVR